MFHRSRFGVFSFFLLFLISPSPGSTTTCNGIATHTNNKLLLGKTSLACQSQPKQPSKQTKRKHLSRKITAEKKPTRTTHTHTHTRHSLTIQAKPLDTLFFFPLSLFFLFRLLFFWVGVFNCVYLPFFVVVVSSWAEEKACFTSEAAPFALCSIDSICTMRGASNLLYKNNAPFICGAYRYT